MVNPNQLWVNISSESPFFLEAENNGNQWNILSQIIHVWKIYLHLSHKLPSFVGKYTIHGSSGYGKTWYKWMICGSWVLNAPKLLASTDPRPRVPPVPRVPRVPSHVMRRSDETSMATYRSASGNSL